MLRPALFATLLCMSVPLLTTESGFAIHSYTREGMSWKNLQLQHSTSILATGSPFRSGDDERAAGGMVPLGG